jgi:Helix-turn-helix domain
MARHRLDRRRVKIHRCYSVEEIARLLGICRATVRRWLKTGLRAIDGQRPALVRGADLLEYLTARIKPKSRCPPGHCYCVKCRVPHPPAGAMAEFVVLTATSGNLRGLCPVCGTMMHRRMAMAQLERIGTNLEVTIVQGVKPLKDSSAPSQNVHFKEHDARA